MNDGDLRDDDQGDDTTELIAVQEFGDDTTQLIAVSDGLPLGYRAGPEGVEEVTPTFIPNRSTAAPVEDSPAEVGFHDAETVEVRAPRGADGTGR